MVAFWQLVNKRRKSVKKLVSKRYQRSLLILSEVARCGQRTSTLLGVSDSVQKCIDSLIGLMVRKCVTSVAYPEQP